VANGLPIGNVVVPAADIVESASQISHL
jgi:hypothetical protein